MEDENQDIIMNGTGMGNGVIPERRHSSTEGSRSSRGEVVTVRLNRRHSLPGGSSGSGGTETSSGGSEGCVIEIHGDRETSSQGSEEVRKLALQSLLYLVLRQECNDAMNA